MRPILIIAYSPFFYFWLAQLVQEILLFSILLFLIGKYHYLKGYKKNTNNLYLINIIVFGQERTIMDEKNTEKEIQDYE